MRQNYTPHLDYNCIVIVIGGGDFLIIYVDVLFTVNFFITYLLLLFTSLMLKRKQSTLRLLAASALGGAYSLVILADSLGFMLTFIGKLLAALIIVFAAFGFGRLTVFLKSVILFFFSNVLFLGIIAAAQMIFKADGIALSNGAVYFDISARALIISAAAAYLISSAALKIYNRTIEKRQIYSVTINKNGTSAHLYALSDSGNKLREPFSDYPVIVADRAKVSFDAERVVPYSTVGGDGVLQAFKPDRVVISNGKNSFETDRVYIAMSDVGSKDFSAVLNPEILNI